MESSTTRPIAMVIAARVSMLRVKPKACIPTKATRTDTGMDTATTSVERMESMKTRITMTEATRP